MTFVRSTSSLLALALGLALTACGGGAADGEGLETTATATAAQVPSIEATDPTLASDTGEDGELIASTHTS